MAAFETRSNGHSPRATERTVLMLEGMSRNLALIAKYVKPIEDYLASRQGEAGALIDWALAQNAGSVPQVMLPFFYQDWSRTRDFEESESLIIAALTDHSPDGEAVAILGAGACGLVRSTAEHFRVVYGLDLSVPTLLIAQAVLSGNPIEIAVALAGWRSIPLSPPAPAKNQIRLLAADVCALPFADGSLSAIVTQYLMDITGDPLGVAAEIQRTLKPGGIWINFSNPFKLPGDPPELGPPEPSELPALFEPLGLNLIKVERTRFNLQNLDPIYAGGHRKLHEVHFFIACKRVLRQACEAEGTERSGNGIKRFQLWDRGQGEWWQYVPKIIPGREVQIIQKRVFGPHGTENVVEIGLNEVRFRVAAEHTAFVEMLFGQITGKHTLREVFNGLLSNGLSLTEMEFRELVYCLLNQYCVITLGKSL
ncbi:MAG TPA: methyltransferase domain-containing protein [Candidatus Angelobacter sp.]|nr:methyltransferase domain-containing protein [Candidatus Angelobacter sp.]